MRSIELGRKASIRTITSEEGKLTQKAAKVLNLAVAGVDIIRSNKALPFIRGQFFSKTRRNWKPYGQGYREYHDYGYREEVAV